MMTVRRQVAMGLMFASVLVVANGCSQRQAALGTYELRMSGALTGTFSGSTSVTYNPPGGQGEERFIVRQEFPASLPGLETYQRGQLYLFTRSRPLPGTYRIVGLQDYNPPTGSVGAFFSAMNGDPIWEAIGGQVVVRDGKPSGIGMTGEYSIRFVLQAGRGDTVAVMGKFTTE